VRNRWLLAGWIGLSLIITASFPSRADVDAYGKVTLSYYLDSHVEYDDRITKPAEYLGFEVGEWHVTPEQIAGYMQLLASQSPRVEVEVIGRTHERRPLMLVYFTHDNSPQKLATLRKQHVDFKLGDKRPLVTWMGYSVHGNEASGANASLLLAYHLAAAQDEETIKWLDNQLIIIDPMLNPDGLARFASWVNRHRSKIPSDDANDIEHNEVWPNGRTNHYWFDLNRDWLLLRHPESKARLAQFHRWQPNVLTDFHEMGRHATYFFQPGVPSRQNPLTPQQNFKLTAKIAQFHARALDDIGSLYYSKESFDDYYYGKGSTYPDINGAIGILFEQASARGHVQESVNGRLSFPFAVRNQLTTSFSTLRAASALKRDLLNYQRDFYRESSRLANADKYRALLLASKDRDRLSELQKLLAGHQIDSTWLGKDISVNRQKFKSGEALVVPLRQRQYRLIKALFETRTAFKDNTFYDVSTWNLAHAFDVDYQWLTRSDFDSELLQKKPTEKPFIFEPFDSDISALAFSWRQGNTTKLLPYLLRQKLKVRAITKAMSLPTKRGIQTFEPGDLLLTLPADQKKREQIFNLIEGRLKQWAIQPALIQSGLATRGPDMGSPSVPALTPIKPLLLVGDGVNAYQAGEIWHLLSEKLEQPVTLMSVTQFRQLPTLKYTHLLMPGGDYRFDEKAVNKIAQWLKGGGVLITQGKASRWALAQGWSSSEVKSFEPPVDTRRPYAERQSARTEHMVGGAIVSMQLDSSHPLAFGLDDGQLPVFKRGQLAFSEPREAFAAVGRFGKKPLLSGYMSSLVSAHLADTVGILVQGVGKGKLIAFSDDMNFRGYFLGSERVYINALYFARIIDAPQKKAEKEKDDSAKSKRDSAT